MEAGSKVALIKRGEGAVVQKVQESFVNSGLELDYRIAWFPA